MQRTFLDLGPNILYHGDMTQLTQYEKLRISLRYFLLGKGYYKAAEALEFAERYHTGTRKDGVTPEFQHQIEIAHYVRTLSLLHPEDTLTAVILHDTPEDYDVSQLIIESKFGAPVSVATELVDKNRWESKERQFEAIANDPIASIVKGADRSHNVQTMVGVFSPEKQLRYVDEVEKLFFPMLKTARRRFPQQEPAYENIKHILVSQITLIKAIHS